jgi:hypothetical protein
MRPDPMTTHPRGAPHAWVEDHRGTYRVRLRLPDGTVVTDSTHHAGPATWSAYAATCGCTSCPPWATSPSPASAANMSKASHQTQPTAIAPLYPRRADRAVPRPQRSRRRPPHPPQPRPRHPHPRPAPHRTTPRHPGPDRPDHGPTPPAAATRSSSSAPPTPACAGANWPACNAPTSTCPAPTSTYTPTPAPCTRSAAPPTSAHPNPRLRTPQRAPPFLVDLLRKVCEGHDRDTVFCGARSHFQRRANFTRRAWRPAHHSTPARG